MPKHPFQATIPLQGFRTSENYGFLATRKPVLRLWKVIKPKDRYDDREKDAPPKSKPPPRTMHVVPDAGPVGSTWGSCV
jgi:hypothetical protein